MSAPIRNTMLVANAGSGKTYALTTRMVKLLALGVEPRKIAALTFTKKAAGEFLDAVFLRLASAALDPKKLDALNRDLNSDEDEGSIPPLYESRCRELLAKLVADSGRLTMGTIDSLFVRIARSFPLESGIPGEFSMIGDAELERARTEALAAIFRESVESAGGTDFLDLVRKISRRRGERKVFQTLLQSVKDFHAKYLEDVSLPWGDADLIWSKKPCEVLAAGDVAGAADAFLAEVRRQLPNLSDSALATLEARLQEAKDHKPGSRWVKNLSVFIKEKLAGEPKTSDDGPYFPLGSGASNRVYLRGSLLSLRRDLLMALLKPVYESLLQKSASLRSFMQAFEESYHALTRSRGRMTFSDVTDLLSSQVGRLEWIASAGYRLDAKLDHWLLDEFQDTSRVQWKVLGSFIDEVIQDSGGERSLFYVGDTKQAIYSWRGGDPKLFFEIFDQYNQGSDDRVFDRELKVSYRSAPEIVTFVNDVFGSISSHAGTLGIPDKTVAAWTNAWREHEPADINKDLKGYVRWVQVRSEEEDENPIHEQVASILEEVRPWEKKLSCGVLTRKNEEASSIAALLQSRGIPVSVEGKSNPCNDNPLGLALLAAFRIAGFPEDTLSLTLLRSSPLAVLLKDGVEAFRTSALTMIAEEGYEAAVRSWTEGLNLNAFLSRRATDFLAAAAEYDESNKGSLSEFVSFLESHVVQESEASGVVRVMTLHQSKGLTFDMSIVTGLDGRGANSTDILHLGGGVPPVWGCLLPSKDEASADPVMNAAREEIRAEEEYGQLCAAYVAMTRSKQALYVLTKWLGPKTTSKNFARLLMLALAPGSEEVPFGNEKWYEDHQPVNEGASKKEHAERIAPLVPCSSETPRPLSPSSLAVKHQASLESESRVSFSSDAADLGTEIHEVLSRIKWDITAVDLSACSEKAEDLLRPFLKSSSAAELFSKPPGDWDLWNEKPFDLMIDGKWVSGCFDRVHVLKENGCPVEARIYDYKTNRSTPEAIAREYQPQMDQYCKAASILLGIGINKVSARTVPVRVSN
jgi:ATP-dependent exoDNAse (exonuclease V) beta subunit